MVQANGRRDQALHVCRYNSLFWHLRGRLDTLCNREHEKNESYKDLVEKQFRDDRKELLCSMCKISWLKKLTDSRKSRLLKNK